MNTPPPELLRGQNLICWSAIDHRHVVTGACQHFNLLTGESDVIPRFAAIIGTDDSYFLLRYDANSQCIADTWHESLEAARRQAEFEYTGIDQTWTACN